MYFFGTLLLFFHDTGKLGFKEQLNKEQLGIIVNHFPWPICQVHLKNIEQTGFGEQLCHDQKVPYYQVWLQSKIMF